MKLQTPIQKSYPGAMCPDCEVLIPDAACDGDACENCGHVFWLDEESVRRTYEAEMMKEMRERR